MSSFDEHGFYVLDNESGMDFEGPHSTLKVSND